MSGRKSKAPAARSAAADRSIGFIGGGNMASALIKGLLASRTYPASRIWVGEKAAAQRRRLQRTLRVQVTADNREVMAQARTVILAVKPQLMDDVLADIQPALREPALRRATLVISIAAGVRLKRLESALGPGSRVVRVMPNTPALVASGISVVIGGRRASRADVARTLTIFRSVGTAVPVTREALLDPVTGLSGSGPAFVYLFAEGLIEGGRRAGLPPKLAERLAFETIAGAAKMLRETGRTPAELRAQVTSPGGTTLAGLTYLGSKDFLGAVRGAVVSATRRSRELASGG